MDANNIVNNDSTSTNGSVSGNPEVYANGLTYDEIIKKDILELMGFTGLTEEKKKNCVKIEEAVNDRVTARIFDTLSESDAQKYDELLGMEKFEDAAKFLSDNGINIEKLLIQETILMKLELIEDSKVLKKRVEDLIANKSRIMASEGISTTQPNETQNQSGETGRDFSRREENFGRFREHVQSTMGNDAKDFLEKFDEFEDKYINSRDRDRSHEATVVKDERGKVKEINAEYMDHALESYLVQFLEAEKSLQNEQVGNERLRGTSKAIKVAAKGLGGVLLTLGSFTGITGAATPFTLSAGIRQ